MASSSPHVAIIGAGTGGLSLAQGLKRAGVSVAVYERDRTRNDGLFGFRVGIDPDGSRALAACLPPDLYDTFVATKAITSRYLNLFTEHRTELLCLDSWDGKTTLPPEEDPINSEKSISRMTLRQVLLTGVEDVVHFDKKFIRYQRNPDGTVTAHFADGTTATSDVLIGADGTSSTVRQQYLPHMVLEDTGSIGITGKLPLTDATRALLTPRMLRGVSLVFAPKGYSCIFHVMEFKWDRHGHLKHGIGGNDAELLRRWPGPTFDNTRDYIMWGLAAPRRDLPEDVLRLRGPELHQLVTDRTRKWHPDFRELFTLADPASCFPINIRTTVPPAPWPTSNITLIGDAAHTMTPGQGVGANTALRDAEILCGNLIAARHGHQPVLAAIGAYETAMHGYAWEAVTKSRTRFGGALPLDRPVIGRIILAGMRTGMRLVNHLPAAKRRMQTSLDATRGDGRPTDAEPAAR